MKNILNNDKIINTPIILFSSIAPIVAYFKKVRLPTSIQSLYGGIKYAPDLFSYYKSKTLIIIGIISIFVFTYYLFIGIKIKIDKLDNLIFLYFGLIVFSIFYSDNTEISLFGFYNLYEGGLVLISYLFMFFYTRSLTNKSSFNLIIKPLLVSASIISIIGVFQFIGHDPLVSKLFTQTFVRTQDVDFVSKIMMNQNKYIMYGTLSNSNYLGSYAAMLLPISIIMSLKEETIIRYLYKIISMLIFINLLGSQSRAGMLGAVCGFIALVLFSKEFIKIKVKELNFLMLLFIAAITIMFTVPSGSISDRYMAIKESDIGNLEKNKPVTKIEYVEDSVQIATKYNVLRVLLIEENIIFRDISGNDLNVVKSDDDNLYFSEPKFNNYALQYIPDNNLILLTIDETTIRLAAISGKGIKALNYNGEIIENLEVEKCNINEKFASSRGYIWSRTLPLIKENVFIGKGPDNFVYGFPQDDIDGKYRVYGDDTILVNKPHNMYLQIAINTGLLSLIVFLIIVVISLYRGFLSKDVIIIAITSGILGYLVAGVFNDSVVSVAPVFWILIGLVNIKDECFI